MARWLNAHITIALPQDEYERIKSFPEIKWAVVARKAVIAYLLELEESRKRSKLWKKDKETKNI